MLGVLLSLEGYDVLTAFDGVSALELAVARRPDMCLCDLGLPGMDGFELAERLGRELPEALLVAVSGWGQEEDRRRSRAAGFKHHFVKPVAVLALLAVLRAS